LPTAIASTGARSSFGAAAGLARLVPESGTPAPDPLGPGATLRQFKSKCALDAPGRRLDGRLDERLGERDGLLDEATIR